MPTVDARPSLTAMEDVPLPNKLLTRELHGRDIFERGLHCEYQRSNSSDNTDEPVSTSLGSVFINIIFFVLCEPGVTNAVDLTTCC